MCIVLPEKGFPGFFTFFISKIFLTNIFSKTLKHISKDAEFCEEFCSIFEIPAELFLKNFSSVFRFLDRRS
jgi:hypothetical protein